MQWIVNVKLNLKNIQLFTLGLKMVCYDSFRNI